jgi:hypothetical protein
MISARELVRSHDLLWVTLDTLRYDVAVRELEAGRTPNIARRLPSGCWELRHTPGTFTYAAHHAFFAGFLPTPATPGRHPRLFAARFAGSETTDERTLVLDAPDVVTGLAALGFKTICIGGVGFFNKKNPLGSVLPSLFEESHWDETLGVTDVRSTENQVRLAIERVSLVDRERPVFLFVNVSAIHQPNRGYVRGAERDSIETHAAALAYVDQAIAPLFELFERRRGALCILTSDHGTAYGDDGYDGHRLAHPCVLHVPYAEFVIERAPRDELHSR